MRGVVGPGLVHLQQDELGGVDLVLGGLPDDGDDRVGAVATQGKAVPPLGGPHRMARFVSRPHDHDPRRYKHPSWSPVTRPVAEPPPRNLLVSLPLSGRGEGSAMATFMRMAEFMIQGEDINAEVPALMASLKKSSVSLYGLWAFPGGPGRAIIYCVPVEPEKFRAFAKAQGLACAETVGVFMTAANQTGGLVPTLERIRAGGVKLHAVYAMAVGEDFGCYFWPDDKDREQLAKVLGAA